MPPFPQSDDAIVTPTEFDRLVRWAYEARQQRLSSDVTARVALLVADEFVALAAALPDPRMRTAQGLLVFGGPKPDAATKAGPIAVAQANAVALSWMELDEGSSKASCHAGLYLLPILSAWAEVSGRSVRSVLTDLAVAYEVLARLAEAYPAKRFSWHPHALWSPIGAALAAALASDADPELATQAIAIASSLTMLGTYSAALDGAEVRNLWSAVGVTSGVQALELAKAGFTGPKGGPGSVLERLNGPPKVGLLDGLGRNWAVFNAFTKPHACCQSMHSAIDAALDLRTKSNFSVADIAEILVETPRVEMNDRTPANRLAAQFSLPHGVASALLWGHGGPTCFSEAACADETLVTLRDKVEIQPWPHDLDHPNARPAKVILRWKDGRHLERMLESSKPIANPRELVLQKATDFAGGAFPNLRASCERLMSCESEELDAPWSALVERSFTTRDPA
jgi:2-methylcitrate dehydratase PrpD